MITLRLKGACAWITFVAVVFGNLTAIAAPASSQHDVEAVAAQSSPQGKLSAVARALKLTATVFRKGGVPLAAFARKLDPDSVAPFLKHLAKICDLLDDLAKIPDATFKVVNQRLFHLLSDPQGAFKIAPGLAKDITEETLSLASKLM
jgi:hypothetical protein